MAANLIITIKGGLVQSILSDEPVSVTVIDYDTDGMNPKELKLIPQAEGFNPEPAHVYDIPAEVNPGRLEALTGKL